MQLEKATSKKRRGGRASMGAAGAPQPWLERTLEIFASLEATGTKQATPVLPTSMTLRDRKVKVPGPSPSPSPALKETKPKSSARKRSVKAEPIVPSSLGRNVEGASSGSSSEGDASALVGPKKLPRVILRLGPDPNLSALP